MNQENELLFNIFHIMQQLLTQKWQHLNNWEKRVEVNCFSKTKIWVHIHRLVGTFFRGKFPFDEKDNPTCSLPFVLLKDFCKDFLLKSCLNLQVMYQDYVHDKIWIFRFYVFFSSLLGVRRPSVVRHKLSHFNLLLRNHWANCNQTLMEWSLI
jgi:hypothetical protein